MDFGVEIGQLAEAIRGGNWGGVVGIALLVLAPAVLYVLEGRWTAKTDQVFSLIRAVALTVGGALVVTTAAGGSWWWAALIGVFGVVGSKGLLDLVRALVHGNRLPPIVPGLLVLVFLMSGCGAGPCHVERSVVNALDAGVSVADAQLRDSGASGWEDASRYSRAAVELGRAAVQSCALLRDSAGWQSWVMLALEAAGSLAAFFGGADDAGAEAAPAVPPSELLHAIQLLEAEEAGAR